jgi:hypothetical protein
MISVKYESVIFKYPGPVILILDDILVLTRILV